MEYELVVEAREKNPDYTPTQGPYPYQENLQYLKTRSLFIVLNEAEFEALKKAVISVMK